MFNDDYWEPPQAVTRLNILEEFYREADRRMLSVGKRFRNETIGQARACILIERFVNRVINYPTPAYWFRPIAGMQETYIGVQLRQLFSLLGFFDSYHDCSEHLCAFLYSCWTIESVFSLDLKKISHPDYYPDEETAIALNSIVESIRMCAQAEWFQRASYDRRYEANAKADSVAQLTAQVLRYYARTMIVRVDLGYQIVARKGLTIDKVYDHWDQFLYLMGRHPVFENLVGYAWSIEQGVDQGFHIHCEFLFDGSKDRWHVNKGFDVGAVWKQVVGEGGKIFNCNANIKSYDQDRVGIGLIDRMDSKTCLNSIEEIRYIAKDTQFLRIKPQGRRTFGSSMKPDIEAKRGRPASQEPEWEY